MPEKITLKAARVNAGLTTKYVSEQTGYSVTTICAWENGTNEPKVTAAMKMAELYGLSVENIKFKEEKR